MIRVPPGSTIGIIGGGQLGRMLAVAAAQLGYRTHIYSPDASGPATELCAQWTQGSYDDRGKLAAFAHQVAVVTYEFENVEADPLQAIADAVPLFPPLKSLRIAQERISEKRFAAQHGARTAPWGGVLSRMALDAALTRVGTPAILKTTRFGYDGKGQARLDSPSDADRAWHAIGGGPALLEGFVAFEREFSVLVARGQDGGMIAWPPTENCHEDGILRTSVVPAHPSISAVTEEAVHVVEQIAHALEHVGVLAVEFFATPAGPVFNEMAPRVHNSGHWTIEGASLSQFEAHIRAICGLPLPFPRLRGSSVRMDNLIGEDVDAWPRIAAEPEAHLHLYGKHESRPGRKMGHVTRLT